MDDQIKINVVDEITSLFCLFLEMPYISNSGVNIGFNHKFFKNKFFQFIFAVIQFIVNYVRGNTHKHEDKVEEILHSQNFVKTTIDEVGLTRQEVLSAKQYVDLDGKWYIPQPIGTTSSPDFIIIYDRRVYYIECKSGVNDKIMFGNSLPSSDYIYLFSCKKFNKTILFRGKDVISDKIRRRLESFIFEMREIEKKFNKDMIQDKTNDHGWVVYLRGTFSQRGGKEFTAWVQHRNKDIYVENVMKFVKEDEICPKN